ncbi:MAG: 1,4-dihydroxy-2-naphthoyl-CoA hydrolase [Pseudomonadota bacterium]|nr:1,4-dihydroxy-2-naphthoyl-CoA hydrolase [Pseudomonadota bacterium]
MAIWQQLPDLEKLNLRGRNTAVENLGIVITEAGDDYLKGTMPVDHRTVQPLGLLHGGASVLFAESLGSIAANYCVDRNKAYCVGMEINANHLRSVKSGVVTGIARPLHLGATTQVWEIKIYNQVEKLVCVSRLTVAVVKKTEGPVKQENLL